MCTFVSANGARERYNSGNIELSFSFALSPWLSLAAAHLNIRWNKDGNNTERNDNNSIALHEKNRKNIEKIVSKDNGGNIILPVLLFLHCICSVRFCSILFCYAISKSCL